jgi:hypothetical protein
MVLFDGGVTGVVGGELIGDGGGSGVEGGSESESALIGIWERRGGSLFSVGVAG